MKTALYWQPRDRKWALGFVFFLLTKSRTLRPKPQKATASFSKNGGCCHFLFLSKKRRSCDRSRRNLRRASRKTAVVAKNYLSTCTAKNYEQCLSNGERRCRNLLQAPQLAKIAGIICRGGRRCRGDPYPQGIQGMHRRLWICG